MVRETIEVRRVVSTEVFVSVRSDDFVSIHGDCD